MGLLSGCLAFAASLQQARVSAQEAPGIELEWSAPKACPPRSEVIDEARRLLVAENGRAEHRLRARAEVVRMESGDWQLSLQVSEPAPARRTLIGEDCTAVARACALLLAMMRSGSEEEPLPNESSARAEETAPVKASPSVDDASPAEPLPPAEQLAPPKPAASRGLDGALGLVPALDVGALPAARPGPGVMGELGRGTYRLRMWLGAYLPSTASIDGVAGAEAQFILAEGMLQGCLMPRFGRLRVGPCLGAATGVLWATATGVPQAESAAEAWVAPLAMLALRWPGDASGLALEAAAGVAWPLRRPSFRLRQGEQIHQSDPVSLRVQLGVSWQL